MPTLKPYEAGVQGLRPTETGIEATAAAARRVGGAYSEAAESVKAAGHAIASTVTEIGNVVQGHMAAMEINRGAPAWAATQLSLDQQWKATHEGSPDNPVNGPKFLNDTLEPRLQAFRSGFFTTEGQAWAERQIDSYREHMYKKTTADAARGHGNAAAINTDQTLNLLSNGVVNEGTEARTAEALKTWNDTATKMRLPQKAIDEGNAKLVEAGISGSIRNSNGETGVPDWANKPEYSKHWDPVEDRKKYDALQRTVATQSRVAEKSKEAQHKKAVLNDYNGQINDLETKMLPTDGSTPILPNKEQLDTIMRHEGSRYQPGSYRALLSKSNALAERMNKADTPDNISKPNMVDIWNQMTPTKEFSEYIDSNFRAGNISQAHWNFLHQRWRELQTEDGKDFNEQRKHFFAGVQEAISPPLGDVTDNTTKTRMANFTLAFERRKAELVKQGEDPMQLMDPDSEFYMGGAQQLRNFLPPSMQRRLSPPTPAPAQPPQQRQPSEPTPVRTQPVVRPGSAQAAPAQPPPSEGPRPGESVDDYLNRTGGAGFGGR
jgi:hypothetical protein